MRIIADTDMMSQVASQAQQQAAHLNTTLQQLSSAVGRLNSWEGASYYQFNNDWSSISRNLHDSASQIEHLGKCLQTAADNFNTTDQQSAAAWAGGGGDGSARGGGGGADGGTDGGNGLSPLNALLALLGLSALPKGFTDQFGNIAAYLDNGLGIAKLSNPWLGGFKLMDGLVAGLGDSAAGMEIISALEKSGLAKDGAAILGDVIKVGGGALIGGLIDYATHTHTPGLEGRDLVAALSSNGLQSLVALNPYGAAVLGINGAVQIGGHLLVAGEEASINALTSDPAMRDTLRQQAEALQQELDNANITRPFDATGVVLGDIATGHFNLLGNDAVGLGQTTLQTGVALAQLPDTVVSNVATYGTVIGEDVGSAVSNAAGSAWHSLFG